MTPTVPSHFALVVLFICFQVIANFMEYKKFGQPRTIFGTKGPILHVGFLKYQYIDTLNYTLVSYIFN
jgi:hypothetical protein